MESTLYLVGDFNHLEKYEFVNGKDYPIYEKENKHDWNHQSVLEWKPHLWNENPIDNHKK